MVEISTSLPRPPVTKAEWREGQRNLSFAEKIALLEKMRERDAVIAKAGLRDKSSGQHRPEPDRESIT